MKKQTWCLYLNLIVLLILLLGWVVNSAKALSHHIELPQNGSCTNESSITLRVEIDSEKERVKTVKFLLDQSSPIQKGNNTSWRDEPAPRWDFSKDITKQDEGWWYYQTQWNVSGISDHSYSLTYWLIDHNGGILDFGQTVSFKSDRTNPSGFITSPSNGQTITGDKIDIDASPSDSLCGVDWVKFLVHTPNSQKGSYNSQWNGNNGDFWFSYIDYSSPWSPPDWNMTGIPDGEVTITIWVRDEAGNQFVQPENERVKVYVDRAPPTCKISGYVRNRNSSGISGVTVSLTGYQYKTDTTSSSGFYEFTDLPSGKNYTVTPSKSGYTFSPPSQSYTPLNSDKTNQNFTGNRAPNQPSNPSPSNGATEVSVNTDLGWSGGDPDGDSVTYDVYFGTSSNPPFKRNQSSKTYDPGTLSYNQKYYWKIVAKDGWESTSSSVWNFTTEKSCTTQKLWNFTNDLEGWHGRNASLSVSSGSMRITPQGSDPGAVSPELCNLTGYNAIKINIKSFASNDDQYAEIFFANNGNNYSGDKSVGLAVKNDQQFHTYYRRFDVRQAWTGILSGIRFDPNNGSGEVYIDYIELYNESSTESLDLQLNKSTFNPGDVLEATSIVTGGRGHTIQNYLLITFPDGSQKYGYFNAGENHQPTDTMYYSSTRRPMLEESYIWNVQDSPGWLFYQHTVSDTEATGEYTWEFWHEDISCDKSDPKTAYDSVSFSIHSQPELAVTPTTLNFGDTKTQDSFQIYNSGSATLSWNLTENIDWLTAIPNSGSSTGTDDKTTVQVIVERAGLSPGNYSETISITSNGGSQTVTVNMNVATPQSVEVKIQLAKSEIAVGETTSFDVLITEVSNFGGFEFKLRYDSNVIEIKDEDVQKGSFVSSKDFHPLGPVQNDSNPQELTYGVSFLGQESGPNGSGSLAHITVKGINSDTTALDLQDVLVIDATSGINQLAVTSTNSTLIVGDTTPPDLVITEPYDGQEFETANITVKGRASDESGIQKVTVNGSLASGKTDWSKDLTLSVGANTIEVIAYDNSSNHNSVTKTITVNYISNTSPVISNLPDQILNEDNNLDNAIDLWDYASDAESTDTELRYIITNYTNANCGVSIDSNRYIDINPTPNWYGYSDVTVKVTDPEGLSDTDTFKITVNSVNDAPEITSIIPNQSESENTPITIDLTIYESDVEDSGTLLDWYVEDTDSCTVSGEYSDDDVLTFTPDTNFVGDDYVTLYLKDSWGLTDSQQIKLTWFETNQSPNTPTNIAPADGEFNVFLTSTLQSSIFSDPDNGDTHQASQWQITTTSGNYSNPVYDSGVDTGNKISISIPAGILNNSTTYYWHVRHQDNNSTWSNYSIETSFTTCFSIDLNCDGKIDINDLAMIAQTWGSTVDEPTYNTQHDFDKNGEIDIFDVLTIANHFGEEAPFVAPPGNFPHVVTVAVRTQPPKTRLGDKLIIDLVVSHQIPLQAVEFHFSYDASRLSFQQADIPAFKALSDSQKSVVLLGPSIDKAKGLIAYGGIALVKNNHEFSSVLSSLEFIAQQTGKIDLELTDVKLIDTQGRTVPVAVHNQAQVRIEPSPPKDSALGQNYPNPFNPETWIPFKLATDDQVIINIYNIKGQVVKRLDLGYKNAGYYLDKTSAAHWDGRSQAGEQVSSGLYFYTIKAGNFTATRRLIMIK